MQWVTCALVTCVLCMLQVREAFGLAATQRLVACACSQGTVRLFSSKALGFKANLPYWSCAGAAWCGVVTFAAVAGRCCSRRPCVTLDILAFDLTESITHAVLTHTPRCSAGTAGVDSSQFADARGCSFGPGSQSEGLLVVAYSSHEVILWDIHNLAQVSMSCMRGLGLCAFALVVCAVQKGANAQPLTTVLPARFLCSAQIHPVRSFASHTGCIWDVCPFRLPNPNPSSSSSRTVHEPEADVVLGCATCATDGFIRFWSSTDPASMLQPMASVQAGKSRAAVVEGDCLLAPTNSQDSLF